MNILFHNILMALSIMSLIVILGAAYIAFLWGCFWLLDKIEEWLS